MTVSVDIEAPGEVQFSAEVVGRAFQEVKETKFPEFLAQERAFVRQDPSQAELFEKVVKVFARNYPGNSYNSAIAGYLLAHRILRYAHDGNGSQLPTVSRARKAALRDLGDNGIEAEFATIYEPHSAIMDLVTNRLTNEESQYGAKLMFVMCGLELVSSAVA